MSEAVEIADTYFTLSNQGHLDEIAEMFTKSSTYSSVHTGVYLGREQIMAMMRPFHESFTELHWEIHSVGEVRPNVVLFDFTMSGIKKAGEKVEMDGLEYVIVREGKLQHVEVRNN